MLSVFFFCDSLVGLNTEKKFKETILLNIHEISDQTIIFAQICGIFKSKLYPLRLENCYLTKIQ